MVEFQCNKNTIEKVKGLRGTAKLRTRSWRHDYKRAFLGICRIACLTPRSPSTSSAMIIQFKYHLRPWQRCDTNLRREPHRRESCDDTIVGIMISWSPCTIRRSKILTCSIYCPIPVFVIPRPPNIWTASVAVSWAHLVVYILSRPIGLRKITCERNATMAHS